MCLCMGLCSCVLCAQRCQPASQFTYGGSFLTGPPAIGANGAGRLRNEGRQANRTEIGLALGVSIQDGSPARLASMSIRLIDYTKELTDRLQRRILSSLLSSSHLWLSLSVCLCFFICLSVSLSLPILHSLSPFVPPRSLLHAFPLSIPACFSIHLSLRSSRAPYIRPPWPFIHSISHQSLSTRLCPPL